MCYAPTELAESAVKDAFYDKLQCALDEVANCDVVLLMADMNAKIGPSLPGDDEVVGGHCLGTRNDNGTRFVDLCQRYGLVIGGSIFPHRDVHKGTWRSPDGTTVNQIDHIAITRKHRSALLDVRSFRGADIGLTDHYLVKAKLRLKLLKHVDSNPPRLYDIEKLKDDSISQLFQSSLESKLEEFPDNDVEVPWSIWRDAVRETAENVLGYRRGRKEEWISNSTWDLIQEKKKLKMQLENSSAAIRTHFKNLHKLKAGEVKRATQRDKIAFYHSKAEEAEEAANRGDQRKLFKIASELGQCKKSYNGVIKDSNGNKISTEEDKMRRWREHFYTVLNCEEPDIVNDWNEPLEHDTGIIMEDFQLDEVQHAIDKLRNNKSPGIDLITGEIMKSMGLASINRLVEIYNKVLHLEVVPSD